MTFANLPLGAVLAGLAALAALLYLLQRLRVRYAEVTVPTTLFWRAAVREAPVRVLRGRFRHWLAYLLILAICALLWLGFAAPEAERDDDSPHHVLFLDGSAHNAAGDDFARSVAALRADLGGLPSGRREVIWGGAYNVKLLEAGEDALLLDQRLAELAPEAAPSAIGEQLRLLATPGAWPEQVLVVVYGRAPVERQALAQLPEGVRLRRGLAMDEAGANQGVVALGIAPAASGRWDRVDALVRVGASAGALADPLAASPALAPALSLELDGAPWEAVLEPLGDAGFAVRDLPAAGGLLAVALAAGGASSIDDAAQIRLPKREPVGVAVEPGLPAAVGAAIEADAGLRRAEDEARVAVRRAGSGFGRALPALELAAPEAQQEAFVVTYPAARDEAPDAERRLRASLAMLGLDQIDATGLASALRRPVALAVRESDAADGRTVSVWAELLAEGFNFTDQRGFPLFFSRSLRWLAGERDWPAYLAAGRPHRQRADDWTAGGAAPALSALGARYVPARAGALPGDDGWIAALLSPPVTERQAGADLTALGAERGGVGAADIATWLALLALALLAAEWALYQRGLMP